jgi:hypothetical protein
MQLPQKRVGVRATAEPGSDAVSRLECVRVGGSWSLCGTCKATWSPSWTRLLGQYHSLVQLLVCLRGDVAPEHHSGGIFCHCYPHRGCLFARAISGHPDGVNRNVGALAGRCQAPDCAGSKLKADGLACTLQMGTSRKLQRSRRSAMWQRQAASCRCCRWPIQASCLCCFS